MIDEDAFIAEVMASVRDKMKREDQALAAARALPVTTGPCPGGGLRAWSAGAYEVIMCPVCYAAPLGEWSRDGWPTTPAHDRRL